MCIIDCAPVIFPFGLYWPFGSKNLTSYSDENYHTATVKSTLTTYMTFFPVDELNTVYVQTEIIYWYKICTSDNQQNLIPCTLCSRHLQEDRIQHQPTPLGTDTGASECPRRNDDTVSKYKQYTAVTVDHEQHITSTQLIAGCRWATDGNFTSHFLFHFLADTHIDTHTDTSSLFSVLL